MFGSVRKAHPSLRGRLVLQDLSSVVGNLDPRSADFESMVYDFFTTQPVYGARLNHIRRVLRDWLDGACDEILRSVAMGLRKGHWTLLINESVLPDAGCSQADALLYMKMMKVDGMERNKSQWEELLGSAGFTTREIF